MTERALLVGRFQPFHLGHRKAVEQFIDDYDLVLGIGSAEKEGTEENPLNFEDRKSIIRACYPDIEIVSLKDFEKDEEDSGWINQLKKEASPDKVISRNSLVKKLVKEDSELELIQQDMYQPDIYSGTEVRRRINSGEEWRYLVPECCEEEIASHKEKIKNSGTQYEFEPGWKKENIQN